MMLSVDSERLGNAEKLTIGDTLSLQMGSLAQMSQAESSHH